MPRSLYISTLYYSPLAYIEIHGREKNCFWFFVQLHFSIIWGLFVHKVVVAEKGDDGTFLDLFGAILSAVPKFKERLEYEFFPSSKDLAFPPPSIRNKVLRKRKCRLPLLQSNTNAPSVQYNFFLENEK